MDVSASMLAQDFSPNRMEAAKDIISSFLDRSRGNRIGTIVFSGKPFLFAPLTHDTDFLTQQIRSVSTESIRQDSIAS